MMIRLLGPFLLILLLSAGRGQAQPGAPAGMEEGADPAEVQESWRDRIRVSGYVKYLQSSFLVGGDFAGVPANLLDQLLGRAIHDHLIHHRLNLRAELGGGLFLHAGWRNRLFYGDQTRLYRLIGADYGREVDRDANDVLDLSFIPLNKRAWVAHSILDRLYLEWRAARWEVRLGRQRVNWGLCTLWNPHDLLNAYSFIDFDYEERPGADALRVIQYTGGGQQVELAVRPADSLAGSTLALLYRGHRRGVNYQALLAWHQQDLALGAGWEADAGPGAWKVEATAFLPVDAADRAGVLALSSDWMRTWPSGLLFGGGYLLNTGAGANANLFADFSERLSARNLYPFRHSLFLQLSYPFHPLLTTALATVYSPEPSHALFLSPVLSYALASDWDLDLTGQILVQDSGRNWQSPVQAFFLRLRFSY
jgi:hypothetical protein